jgi:sulfur-oxidizing protein SoxY
MHRRILLQAALGAAQLGVLLAAGLAPRRLIAAWPADAFHAEALGEAERLLFGDRPIEDSDGIRIEAPDIAENGRNVPITVETDLTPPFTLVLLADKNPTPLLARARFEASAAPSLSVRVKLGASGNLIAVAEQDGRLLRGVPPVKVTAGGCGG